MVTVVGVLKEVMIQEDFTREVTGWGLWVGGLGKGEGEGVCVCVCVCVRERERERGKREFW